MSLLDLTDVSAPDCCRTVVRESLDPAAAEQHARVFKALGDPTRLRLLSIVAAHDDAEACVCDLTEPVGLAQATVSHHLKVLVDAGLLTRSQRGRWGYYALVPGALDRVARSLTQVEPAGAERPAANPDRQPTALTGGNG